MMKYLPSVVLSLGLAVLSIPSRADEPLRKWTDQSGEYQVEGKLVSISSDGDTVSIELPDQQMVDVAIERLSSDDRRYLLRYKRLQSKRKSRSRPQSQPSRTVRLYGIDWHPSLESASAAGSPSRAGADRPIMCFRVLGDLAGYM